MTTSQVKDQVEPVNRGYVAWPECASATNLCSDYLTLTSSPCISFASPVGLGERRPVLLSVAGLDVILLWRAIRCAVL
jgi:hypothetical protein